MLNGTVGSNPTLSAKINAQIAQSVEQGTENPRVGGSIPPLGTRKCGGIAQLARAFGSYPKGHRFDSCYRYQFKLMWTISSVGQSARLITGRSGVRVPDGPLIKHRGVAPVSYTHLITSSLFDNILFITSNYCQNMYIKYNILNQNKFI